jgi:hypothetical protein
MIVCKGCGWSISASAEGWRTEAGGLECGSPLVGHRPRRDARQEFIGHVRPDVSTGTATVPTRV